MSLSLSELESLVRWLGGSQVTTAPGGKVRCCCLLAPWTHTRGRDRHPSMALFVEGRYGVPVYTCLGCHESGSVRDLLCFLWSRTGRNPMYWIEKIDGTEGLELPTGEHALLRGKLDRMEFDPVRRRLVVQDDKPREPGWYDYGVLAECDAVSEMPEEVFTPYATVPTEVFERGITEDTCRVWGLGRDPVMGRVLFSMRDRHQRLVAVSGRLYACPGCGLLGDRKKWSFGVVVDDVEVCRSCRRKVPPKYLHSAGFKRNLFLYGEHRFGVDRGRTLYLVEGHFDTLAVWQAGLRPVAGLLGSHPGQAQIEKIVAGSRDAVGPSGWARVAVIPDGDAAGAAMATKLKYSLRDRVPCEVIALPDGEDPASVLEADPNAFCEYKDP